jgi:radical SAM superfamily enzyme YgiQ (UPF0313 family)
MPNGMGKKNPTPVRKKVRLSRAIMLALTSEGLRIPGLDTISAQPKHPPLAISSPELDLLVDMSNKEISVEEALEFYGQRFAMGAPGVADFLDKLAERDLLARGPARAASATANAARPVAEPYLSVAVGASDTFAISVPLLVCLDGDHFLHIDHLGKTRISLSKIELMATAELHEPLTLQEFHAAQLNVLGTHAFSVAEAVALLRRLAAAGLVQRTAAATLDGLNVAMRRGRPTFGRERAANKDWSRFQRLNERMRESIRAFDAAEYERERKTGKIRTRVIPVQQNGVIVPLALGMIFAYAKAYNGGSLEDHYAFHPDWLMRPSKIRGLVKRPAIFLMSNYNWSHRHNLTVSAKVRELSPTSVIIHGGPNTPKHAEDCEAYFNEHPEVDIAVRGEGEQTVAELLDALKNQNLMQPIDNTPLYDIPGLSFREGDKIVRTADRSRIADLDAIPSPYLTGLFDVYEGTELAIIETNRGCPYSCTFCDWGSAIGTRIRQFSLDRVFLELEWCSAHNVAGIMCADANFGIFERDVEIAQKVAQLKRRYGFPNGFSVSAAKNKTKHTKEIIQILVGAGVMSKGSIGVQSTDTATLRAVRRSNIKLESYDELAAQFQKSGLPLWTDLMFGLPGQTYSSFKNDLQGCVDRAVFPRMFMTELLVNSPMNERSYRERYKIETELSPDGSRKLVVATSTFTRQEYEQMNKLRLIFILGDAIGMLRHLAHYARAEARIREIDFYDGLARALDEEPELWPVTRFVVRALPALLIPPVSWHLLASEVSRYLVEKVGITDDSALRSVVHAQCAVMPTHGYEMPASVLLEHDYAAWYLAMLAARDAGHSADWPEHVPSLRTLPPGLLQVDDPDSLCDYGIGATVDGDLFGNYELRSAIARWRVAEAAPETLSV